MTIAAPGGTGTETPTVKIEDTPEFKAAMKREREQLEANIRESNQQHLAKKEAELEEANRARLSAGHGAGNGAPAHDKPDFFEEWGTKYGIAPEAGRELVGGVLGHIESTVLPKHLLPLNERSKRQDIRNQRQELRASNPKLSKLDDRFHAEATAKVEALKPDQIGPDSYAKALQMVIGSHVEELMAEPKEPAPGKDAEIVPGVEPTGSAPAPRKTVALNAEQKRFVEERGMTEESFVEMMRERAQALEGKGHSKAQVRARFGPLLGSLEF